MIQPDAVTVTAVLAPAPVSSMAPSLSACTPTSAVTTTATATAATATHHKRLTKPRKTLCGHGRRKTQCVDCYDLGIGGGSICKHRRRKDGCRECRIATPASASLLLAAHARKWTWNPPRPWEASAFAAVDSADWQMPGVMPETTNGLADATSVTCHKSADSVDAEVKDAPPSTHGSITSATATPDGDAAFPPPLLSLAYSRQDTIVSSSRKRPGPTTSPSNSPSPPDTRDYHLCPRLHARLRQLHFLRLQYARSRIAAAAVWNAALSADHAAAAGYYPSDGSSAAAAYLTQPFDASAYTYQMPAHAYSDPWPTAWPAGDRRLEVPYHHASASAAAAPSTAAAVAAHLSRCRAGALYPPAV